MLLKYDSLMKFKKTIHLLYAPTMFCNMGCSYCYLGELTNVKDDEKKSLETLKYTINEFISKGYLPFNISFHGGEVTTISPKILKQLFVFVEDYYNEYKKPLEEFGFRVKVNHIKTNLYNTDNLIELFNEHKISISGSLDLPLHLHSKYRVSKKNTSTLNKIVNNIKLLSNYKHNKKLSCVVTKEHLNNIKDFANDIKYIHYDLGFDMTKFNIMFGFESIKNKEKFTEVIDGTQMLTDQEMVIFYEALEKEFVGTDLEHGFKRYWFEEFTPVFCCSAENCGNKFFLIQSNGDVYSCPRGQSSKKYKYGNVFKNGIQSIINSGFSIIQKNENELEISNDCLKCEYIKYCNIGCTFVRDEGQLNKSYTCLLQKKLYEKDPHKYPPLNKSEVEQYSNFLQFHNNIKSVSPERENMNIKNNKAITTELYNENNTLSNIIKKDHILQQLYSEENFLLEINGVKKHLKSQILKDNEEVELLSKEDEIFLYIHKNIFNYNADKEVYGNNILIMCLRDTLVVYGDENRTKQEHLFDYSLYNRTFKQASKLFNDYYSFNLKPILEFNASFFIDNISNNIFFTTKKLREYHYLKHEKNAFYHIQAINLPFPNFEFIWID